MTSFFTPLTAEGDQLLREAFAIAERGPYLARPIPMASTHIAALFAENSPAFAFSQLATWLGTKRAAPDELHAISLAFMQRVSSRRAFDAFIPIDSPARATAALDYLDLLVKAGHTKATRLTVGLAVTGLYVAPEALVGLAQQTHPHLLTGLETFCTRKQRL
jgi:hypothetical protein